MIFGHNRSPSGLLGPHGRLLFPPCRDKLVQWWNTVTDGTAIDRIGVTGSEVGRDGVSGAYFDGDGTRYVDLDETINLGTVHEIEFKASLTTGTLESICGNSATANSQISLSTSDELVLRIGTVSRSYPLVIDGEYHIYELKRTNLSVTLYVDGVEDITRTFNSNDDLELDMLFNRFSPAPLQGNCSYIKFTYDTDKVVTFNFEEGNTDTKVIGTSADGPVTGEIINPDGSDRVSTTALESRADIDGYTEAKALGKNLFNGLLEVGSFDISTGEKTTSSDTRSASETIVSPSTSYVISTSGTSGTLKVFEYEKDGTYIGVKYLSYSSGYKLTTSSNCYWININAGALVFPDGISELIQLEEGTTATTYEAWEGYYYDQALTEPMPDGVIIPTYNSKAMAYTTGGVLADAEWVGELKANIIETDAAGTATEGGDYLKQVTTKYSVVQADLLTTVQMYDHTDPDAVTAEVVAKSAFPNIDGDARYTIDDGSGNITEQYLYSEALEEPCYTNANKYGDLVEPLDSEGSQLYDSDGSPMYALKSTTTREVL